LLTLSKNFFMNVENQNTNKTLYKSEKKSLYKNGLAIYTMPVVNKMLSFRSLFREKMPYVT